MEGEQKRKVRNRARRSFRLRGRVRGTSEKPRLCIVKTNKHIHAQLIDDERGCTLLSISTLSSEFRTTEFSSKSKPAAKQLGLTIAKLAQGKQIAKAVVDRGFSKYHGVVAALADGAREGGLVL